MTSIVAFGGVTVVVVLDVELVVVDESVGALTGVLVKRTGVCAGAWYVYPYRPPPPNVG